MNTHVNQVLMNKGGAVVTIGPEASVYDAVKRMCDKQIGSLLVVNDDGTLAGIFSERDCFTKVILADRSAREVKVKDVMTAKVIYVSPDTRVDACMALLTQKRIRHVPVLDAAGTLTGIISIGDLVKYVSSEQETMIRDLEKYIEGSL